MIVALYARVSTTRQAEKDLSMPDQLKQMRKWCDSKGCKVAVEYVEPGASATDDRRPVFQQMISEACVSPSPFGAIIVHSLSRFFRDSIEFGLYERKLKKYDVNLFSITQQTGDDPAGEMARKIFNVFDEYQSRENAKHTLRAMKENARQGFFNGSSPPFGFCKVDVPAKGRRGNKKRLEIDHSEAAIAHKVFNIYLNGIRGKRMGMKGIAYYLNEHGITRRGRKWSKSTINDLLDNRVYVGEYYFNKTEAKTRKIKPVSEWIKIKIEPIVDLETFKRVQQLRINRSPSKVPPRIVNSPTLLTGLLKCGFCGSSMTIATGKGGRYRYYKCTNRINKGKRECANGNIRMEKLDSLVLQTVSEKVFTPSRIKVMMEELKKRLSKNRSSYNGKLKTLTNDLNEMDLKVQRLYEAVENGLLPMDDTLKERAQTNKARREEMLIEIARLRQRKEIPLSRFGFKQISTFCSILKDKFSDQSINFGKEYLRLLIDEIKFSGREVVIKGSYAALCEAIPRTKPDPTCESEGGVPGFGIGWLPVTDSN
jgi:site-specific DNA recombinase